MALMGIGEHEGDNAADEAIKAAMESPLLDSMSRNGAMGVLVHFSMHPDFSMMKLAEAMEVVHNNTHDDTEVIWGTSIDKTLPKNYMKITVIATGFEYYEKFNKVERTVIENLKNSGWNEKNIVLNNKSHIDILLKDKNKTIAVIELKAQKNRLNEALIKAVDYAKRSNISFAFATNGKEIYEYNFITSKESIIHSFPSLSSLQSRTMDKSQLVSRNRKSDASDIAFYCEKCSTEYTLYCKELDWEQVGGSERNMGSELEYEAEYYDICISVITR
jgi:hypothetical protein